MLTACSVVPIIWYWSPDRLCPVYVIAAFGQVDVRSRSRDNGPARLRWRWRFWGPGPTVATELLAWLKLGTAFWTLHGETPFNRRKPPIG